ncbi:hypothetical protein [Fluviibacter phosphoraccumulans]|jgi:hypothetical protein|uniref:Uncharacterized protein n=1 Tax=Fluviibacter phosphoraccumulans TaxID=1751046 RepID=A0A679HUT7_9RHOO|nr:hypothetical protein [Fluviibacter phosphoraccumulans]BBU69355.1 hypothetical protein ICHIAU1_16380 [Fluviibacter phosphoraccumulans]BBU71462.1 hypothetical protein ICHIJ1_13810 [Fluviibacter phosphoraccumulans]BCA65291.1 hypothetical protein SHINM1_008930 [Fluviibacter phosphoraccumulans]
MNILTPDIARQIIGRGWHVATHEYRNYKGNIEVTQDVGLDYDYCTPEAMQMLVDWKQKFQSFQANFKSIEPEVAGKIARINCNYLYLPKLEVLEVSEARRLSRSIGDVLHIGLQTEPSPEAIEVFIDQSYNFEQSCNYLIDLQLPTLSVDNARILAKHPNEFYLELPFQALTPTALAILSGHIGFRLNLRLTGFDGVKAHAQQVLEVLSRTPCKRAVCVYLDENVVRFESEERDWGRWKRRMDRMGKLAAEQ